MINKIIYNYKFVVTEIVDGRTVDGVLDLGFRIFQHRSLRLAGINFNDPSRPKSRDEIKKLSQAAKPCLETALLWEDSHSKGHGRTVVVSTTEPDRYGKSSIWVSVPCENRCEPYPQITFNLQGQCFINVLNYMKVLSANRFNLEEAKAILDPLKPHDFIR